MTVPFDRYARRCRIINTVDGDTIDVEIDLGFGLLLTERVRLLGVNTAELNSVFINIRIEAAAAREYVIDWDKRKRWDAIDWAWPFTLRTIRNPRDKYGRLLARIWADDGTELGAGLLAAGLAELYLPK